MAGQSVVLVSSSNNLITDRIDHRVCKSKVHIASTSASASVAAAVSLEQAETKT